ncbi:DNA polymerase III subunit delta, partial [candidate division GN15 bacterium]
MTPKQLLADITAGKFAPVYYFYGDEDFRMIEAEKFIAGHFISAKLHLTNYRRLDGKRTSCADLMAELSVFPMLGERQLFAVTDIQHYKPTELERILKMLSPEDKNRVVVLSTPSSKKPKRDAAILKKMNQIAVVVEFKQLTPAESEEFIVARLRKSGLAIEKNALKLLVELLAGNRGAMDSEIEKLVNYKAGAEKVTVEDIQAVAGGYQTYAIWDIGDFVVQGNTKKALSLIRKTLSEGVQATTILSFLTRHLIDLYLVQNNKPLEPNRRWLAYRLRDKAGIYKSQQLERMIVQAAKTEGELRRAKVKPERLLEMF